MSYFPGSECSTAIGIRTSHRNTATQQHPEDGSVIPLLHDSKNSCGQACFENTPTPNVYRQMFSKRCKPLAAVCCGLL
eukprot:11144577-Alexandrium_andersonii.AAC.1